MGQQLSYIVASLAAVASLGGIFWDGLYRDSEMIQAVWLVNDLITLFVAVPLLLGSVYFALQGSLRASFIWVGVLWYLIYNYAFYMYGAVFNAFYLLYILTFSITVYALVCTIYKVKDRICDPLIVENIPAKVISRFLLGFAAALGIPWAVLSLSFVFSGEIPPFEMTIVFTTDLTLLVSVLVFAGILLRKNSPWGVVVAAMIMLKGVLYPVVLITGGILAFFRTGIWDAFIPLYALLWLLCMLFYSKLLRNIK